ncbi:MAG: 16S rRNA (cytosine(1402)-N(4))-methyltransferase, partial [bacterium]
MNKPKHIPVMLDEVVDVLVPRDGAIFVDATFGGGGYTEALLSRAKCVVYAIDQDPGAIARGQDMAHRFGDRLTLIEGQFSQMDSFIHMKADGVAFDVGVSSFQLDDAGRGFSFMTDGPLDMRMSAK